MPCCDPARYIKPGCRVCVFLAIERVCVPLRLQLVSVAVVVVAGVLVHFGGFVDDGGRDDAGVSH